MLSGSASAFATLVLDNNMVLLRLHDVNWYRRSDRCIRRPERSRAKIDGCNESLVTTRYIVTSADESIFHDLYVPDHPDVS